MAKFHGAIGFGVTSETSPGVWTDTIVEVIYTGDVLRRTARWSISDKINNDITLQNQISVVADPYLSSNLPHIRYISYMGTNWTISDVEINRPRIVLSLGSVYNGPTA